jgi:hypothetical protein
LNEYNATLYTIRAFAHEDSYFSKLIEVFAMFFVLNLIEWKEREREYTPYIQFKKKPNKWNIFVVVIIFRILKKNKIQSMD